MKPYPYHIITTLIIIMLFLYICRIKQPKKTKNNGISSKFADATGKTGEGTSTSTTGTTGTGITGTQTGEGTGTGTGTTGTPTTTTGTPITTTTGTTGTTGTTEKPRTFAQIPYVLESQIQNPEWRLSNGEMYLDSRPVLFYGDNLILEDGINTAPTITSPDAMENTQLSPSYQYYIKRAPQGITIKYAQYTPQTNIHYEGLTIGTFADGVIGVATGRAVIGYKYGAEPIILIEFYDRTRCQTNLIDKNITQDWILATCGYSFINAKFVKPKL